MRLSNCGPRGTEADVAAFERRIGVALPADYRRFLLEQIVHNSPLLHDPETIQALFAEGTPKSAESEVFHALVMYRSGEHSRSEIYSGDRTTAAHGATETRLPAFERE